MTLDHLVLLPPLVTELKKELPVAEGLRGETMDAKETRSKSKSSGVLWRLLCVTPFPGYLRVSLAILTRLVLVDRPGASVLPSCGSWFVIRGS